MLKLDETVRIKQHQDEDIFMHIYLYENSFA